MFDYKWNIRYIFTAWPLSSLAAWSYFILNFSRASQLTLADLQIKWNSKLFVSVISVIFNGIRKISMKLEIWRRDWGKISVIHPGIISWLLSHIETLNGTARGVGEEMQIDRKRYINQCLHVNRWRTSNATNDIFNTYRAHDAFRCHLLIW